MNWERDQLSYDQRTASDASYPPSVVRDRLAALRRDRWLAWSMLVAAGAIVGGVLVGITFDWALAEFAVGLLMAVPFLGGSGARNLVYCGKAEQLYDLLRRIDEVPDSASASSSSSVPA